MCVYRIEAVDDCVIIEIGTRPGSISEVVRLEDDYGRAAPDTKKKRIKSKDERNADGS